MPDISKTPKEMFEKRRAMIPYWRELFKDERLSKIDAFTATGNFNETTILYKCDYHPNINMMVTFGDSIFDKDFDINRVSVYIENMDTGEKIDVPYELRFLFDKDTDIENLLEIINKTINQTYFIEKALAQRYVKYSAIDSKLNISSSINKANSVEAMYIKFWQGGFLKNKVDIIYYKNENEYVNKDFDYHFAFNPEIDSDAIENMINEVVNSIDASDNLSKDSQRDCVEKMQQIDIDNVMDKNQREYFIKNGTVNLFHQDLYDTSGQKFWIEVSLLYDYENKISFVPYINAIFINHSVEEHQKQTYNFTPAQLEFIHFLASFHNITDSWTFNRFFELRYNVMKENSPIQSSFNFKFGTGRNYCQEYKQSGSPCL